MRKQKSKRGVLYTVALSLFAFLLLSMSVLFFRHATETESRHIELSVTQSILDAEESLQNIFSSAIATTGVTFHITTSSVTINEQFPRSFTELDNLITTLIPQVESSLRIVNVSTQEFFTEHEYNIEPYNITYEHKSANRIRVTEHNNIIGYNISMEFVGNISSCVPNIVPDGSYMINVKAQSSALNCTITETNVNDGDIEMTVQGENVKITLSNNGRLDVESNATVTNSITILTNNINNQLKITAPIHLLFNHTSYGISKKSKVTFPTLP